MKQGRKIGKGAVRAAVFLAVILSALGVVNLLLFAVPALRSYRGGDTVVSEYAEQLTAAADGFRLPRELQQRLDRERNWAILIGADGRVVWEHNRPREIPVRYSIADVAGFSRWYLEDYPVQVWRRDDGLFVLGMPKDSRFKMVIEEPVSRLHFFIRWLPLAVLCNFLLILLVSYAFVKKWYQQRDRARAAWITAISHDVRTPLAVVMGYAGSLEADQELSEAKRAQAALIRAKSEEMGALISDLNLTNRLEYAMEPLELEEFGAAAVVRETAAEFLNNPEHEAFELELEISAAAERRMIRGERRLIKRMLDNLLRNSVRHNPGGCLITLELSGRGKWVIITVRDNGSGFEPEQLSRLNSKRSRIVSGHGMGLEIVKQAARSHGGKVRFFHDESGGAGSSITLRSKD